MILRLIAVTATAVVLSSCIPEQFQPNAFDVKEVRGKVYLINKETGSLFIKEDERLVELKRYDDALLKTLARSRKLGLLPLRGLEFDLRAKYFGGKLHYNFQVSGEEDKKFDVKSVADSGEPNIEASKELKPNLKDPNWAAYWERDGNRLFLKFQDRDGFAVAQKVINLAGRYRTNSIRIVGDDGTVAGFRYEGSIKVPIEHYEVITTADINFTLKKPEKKQSQKDKK